MGSNPRVAYFYEPDVGNFHYGMFSPHAFRPCIPDWKVYNLRAEDIFPSKFRALKNLPRSAPTYVMVNFSSIYISNFDIKINLKIYKWRYILSSLALFDFGKIVLLKTSM